MELFVTGFLSLLGGIVHGVTGFGSGIIIMMGLPYFFDVVSSSAMTGLIVMVITIAMAWQYRHHIPYKKIAWPLVFYIAGCTVAIMIATSVDKRLLKLILGVFLTFLAIYFIFFSEKAKIKATFVTQFICGFGSGMCDGLFGIGGPLLVLYFLAVTDDLQEYQASIQPLFFAAGLYSLSFRMYRGIITVPLMKNSLIGMAAILVGLLIGTKLASRLNAKLVKKSIYALLAFSGVTTILSSL